MTIVMYLLAGFAMTIAKGLQVQKQLYNHCYAWKSFGIISLAWSLMTLPFIVSSCNEVSCRWSLKFDWWAALIQELPLVGQIDPSTTTIVVMVAYLLLTVYFLGHCFGWILYGMRRLVGFAV